MSEKLVLIDGNSILNRAFYGMPNLTNSKGVHTNAVYGFLNIMFKILEEEKPEYLTVAFDVKAPTFRHIKYDKYKGTRKPMPEELKEQMPIIKEVLKAMHITILEKAGYEADDILGTLAREGERKGFLVSLISGDRDLLQLATNNIKIRIPKTQKGITEIFDYNTDDVIAQYMITPSQIVDLKGLMGDASDNIPGVPGIGEKTAIKILTAFNTVENAYEHIDEIMPNKARESLKENYDLAVLSKDLATIKVDCELEYSMEDAKIDEIFNEEAYVVLKKLEFKSLIDRFYLEVSHNNKVEEYFKELTTMKEIEKLFKKITMMNNENTIGLQFLMENERILGVSICLSENDINFFYVKQVENEKIQEGQISLDQLFSEEVFNQKIIEKNTENQKMNTDEISLEYVISHINTFIKDKKKISVLDLKKMLPFVNADEESNIIDAGVAAYLLNPLKDSYFYDDIARDYLNITVPSKIDLIGKLSFEKAISEKKEEVLKIACYMAYIAYAGSSKLNEYLKNEKMLKLYEDIEMPLVYTLFDMEQRGIHVNKEELKVYSDKLTKRIVTIESEIYDYAGETFNINSPKQLGIILFEKMNMPFAKKTKTGYSTSADILEKLRCEHPIVSLVLEYRGLTKLKSTYAEGLSNYIREDDQRIHGTFNQTITATGRISSTEPNLQNIPIRMELGREIRKVFIPEKDYVFVDADYSQIELRVLAHMSDDETLIAAYREAQDIHKITASQVFHTPLDEVSDIQRSNAKAVNFGIVYGISSFGLGQDLNISRKEAEKYIKDYFITYPKIKTFLDQLVIDAKENNFAITLFGRRRPVLELSSSNFMQRSFGERIAMNSPIQGTAADIIKIAMIRVNKRIKALKLKSKLILQIHDELLVETHKDEIEIVKDILTEEMHNAADLSVPLEIDINTGNSWFESK